MSIHPLISLKPFTSSELNVAIEGSGKLGSLNIFIIAETFIKTLNQGLRKSF